MKYFRILTVLIASLLTAQPLHAQPYTPIPIDELVQAAEQGDPRAMLELGVRYETGYQLPKNENNAFHWYTQAAKAGNTTAMINLGWSYADGTGTPADPDMAIEWFNKAAELGDPEGYDSIAYMYDYAEGVPEDLEKAELFYLKAIDMGCAFSATNYADMLTFQDDISQQDLEKARNLYRLAAETGDAYAMYSYGYDILCNSDDPAEIAEAMVWTNSAAQEGETLAMETLAEEYDSGRNVPRNPNTAALWYEKAAMLGNPYAMQELSTRVTPTTQDLDENARAFLWLSLATHFAWDEDVPVYERMMAFRKLSPEQTQETALIYQDLKKQIEANVAERDFFLFVQSSPILQEKP